MQPKILDATPEKRIFLSIISEYDLKKAICELIDNAIDLWTKKKRADLEINISLDTRQQTISILDNAGGIEESKLDHVVSPGKTSNDVSEDVIGYFGVGSKRAVVALAQDISIHSRFENEKTYTVKFDENWIDNDTSWELPYIESNTPLDPFTTRVELSKLRIELTEDAVKSLSEHLSEVYAYYLERGASIEVNGNYLSAKKFDEDWSYPPKLFPVQFSSILPIENRSVEVQITSGLINHPGDPDDSYGVFVYCNNRLVARGMKDFSVGFSSGHVGNPHYNISLVRTIVKLKGQSRDMPWDSSKSGIDTKHPVFQSIRESIIDATKLFAQVSRSLQGKWDTSVFPYTTGHIKQAKLNTIASIPKSYLPTPPPSKKNYYQKVSAINSALIVNKPWIAGLLDSIVAADTVYKNSVLAQKNRISLIILDSTLEIAYKEYLVHEKNIGQTKFNSIVRNRTSVEAEVANNITIIPTDKKKIAYYYKLRSDLIHQRTTPNVTDAEVEDYKKLIEKLLLKMFGLQC